MFSASRVTMAGCLFVSLVGHLVITNHSCNGWISNSPPALLGATHQRASRSALFSSNENVESFSLAGVENHEEEGEKMASSIIRWLDSEVRTFFNPEKKKKNTYTHDKHENWNIQLLLFFICLLAPCLPKLFFSPRVCLCLDSFVNTRSGCHKMFM